MTNGRRELMMRVMDGVPGILPYLHHFDHYRRCDDMLAWLIRNRITGTEFLKWVHTEHVRSLKSPGQFILNKIKREDKSSPILFGRDFA